LNLFLKSFTDHIDKKKPQNKNKKSNEKLPNITYKTRISDICSSEIHIYSCNEPPGESKTIPPLWNFFKTIKMFLYNKDYRYGYLYKDISFSFPYVCTSVTLVPIYNDLSIDDNINDDNEGEIRVIDIIDNDYDNDNDIDYTHDNYNDNMHECDQNKLEFLETKILLLDITHGTYDEVLMYVPESDTTG
jgi:hypothetical protein